MGDDLRIAFAKNVSTTGRLGFQVHKDWMGKEIDVDVVAFEKRDSFDVNFDGRDDYAHLGRLSGKPVMTYLLSKDKK